LSGGQQQMLALGMALLSRPRLLLVDELSLGLAPIVVSRLAALVEEVAREGTAVVLVEQSVNVALSLATHAYFIEPGEVRFSGPHAGRAGHDAAPAGEEPLPPRGGPVLQPAEVPRRFGGIDAVSHVSFDVAAGEVLGLLGQNGAGKTTLFDLVSGYQSPDGGKVLFEGVDVTRWAPHRRAAAGLGRTFQGGRLFPGLTVTEAIAVSLERTAATRDPLNAALR